MKKAFKISHIFVNLLFITFLISCNTENKPLKIGISRERADVKVRYSTWLSHQQIPFSYIDLSRLSLESATDSLKLCDALLLSGGEDIHPAYFGKEADTVRCGLINTRRDSLEMMLYDLAKAEKMPVLGICRGLQLINVAEGGSLYIDLPEDLQSGELHRIGSEEWTEHWVRLRKNSLLSNSLQLDSLNVASNHHQGIEQLATTLIPLAYSKDGLIESIGWAQVENKNFLLAVQWHPEWMNHDDFASGEIARMFLTEALKRKSFKQ